MFVEMEKIVVDDRIRKDYGNLQELADNISENTLMNPPVVMPNGDGTYTLIAGERRLRAMRDILGYMQTEVNVVTPRDAEQMLLMEISENECRKEFTMTERLDYAAKIKAVESVKAQERMLSGKAQDPVPNSAQGKETGKTRDKAASSIGMGHEKLRQAQYISDNRDLLDPADFAEWDEGKLSTNKAFQRIKAAMEQAEKERDEARKDAEDIARKYGSAIVQRDEAKEDLASERGKNDNLRSQNAGLRKELDRRMKSKPEVIEREVEVVREVVPEDVRRRIESLEYYKNLGDEDNQKLRKQNEELRKKLDRAKVLLKEKGYEDNASWDISALTSAINQLLRTYGGKVWAFDQFYRVDEVTQHEFTKAITNLAAFSQSIVQYISDSNKLEA